jgi:hypothetical protein
MIVRASKAHFTGLRAQGAVFIIERNLCVMFVDLAVLGGSAHNPGRAATYQQGSIN